MNSPASEYADKVEKKLKNATSGVKEILEELAAKNDSRAVLILEQLIEHTIQIGFWKKGQDGKP